MRGAAVIFERHGRVLLLRRSPRLAWMPNHWDLPGGHVEPGETAAQAAAREAFEETGLVVHGLRTFARARYQNYVTHVFCAMQWTGRVRLSPEHTQFAWLPPARWADVDLIPPQADVLARFFSRS
jgi:8-oxo-dGTP diphosphatase